MIAGMRSQLVRHAKTRYRQVKRVVSGGLPMSRVTGWDFACVQIDLRAFELLRGR